MAIRTQQFDVAGVRSPILEPAAPSVAGLGAHLGSRINVVDVQRPEIREPALDTFTAERGDDGELALPIAGMLVDSGTIPVPISPRTFRRTKLRGAIFSTLATLSVAAPTVRQIAGLTAIFASAVAKAIRVHLSGLATVRAGNRDGLFSHGLTIAKYIAAAKPKYFDIACRRIEEAYRQADLFIEPPPKKAEQLVLP